MKTIIKTINPTTGKMIQEYETHDLVEIESRLESLYKGWQEWKGYSLEKRGEYFLKIAAILKERQKEYATLITTEMGKPIRMAMAEIEKSAKTCEYFAAHSAQYLGSQSMESHAKKTTIHYQPLGIILGIMPWNFPFWQVFRALCTSLISGNVFLLKHAPISTGASLAIEKLFQEVLPITIFKSLIAEDTTTSDLIAHSKIAAVTLTGSVRAGRAVAEKAARAMKKCVLELGGVDPYIILEDADIKKAAKICVKARLSNSGQICIAPKRLIVVDAVYEAFREEILTQMKEYVCGDPINEDTELGPLAREDLRDLVAKQVSQSLQEGATLLCGGKIPERPGFYYEPTVLENIMPGMTAFDEEIFGPVIALIRAKDENEAINLANQSLYGLGSGIFTENLEHGEYLAAHKIEAGACAINGIVSSDPRVPFGGVKLSGFGYELGEAGCREFVHMKTVSVI